MYMKPRKSGKRKLSKKKTTRRITRRRKHRTRKQRGGLFDRFIKSNTKTDATTQSVVHVMAEKANTTKESNNMLIDFAADENIGRAAALGAAITISKAVIVGITAVGLASPVGPGVMVLLLVAHKLADIYKNNLILQKLMLDVMNILLNLYNLNAVIDKSVQIMFIYNFHYDGFYGSSNTNGLCKYPTNTKLLTELFNTAKENAKKNIENKYNSNVKVDIANVSIVDPTVLAKNNLYETTVNEKDNEKDNKTVKKSALLLGKISKNKDIEDRLFVRIQALTTFLLELSPTDLIVNLYNNPDIQSSAFGDLLKNEYNQRGLPKNSSDESQQTPQDGSQQKSSDENIHVDTNNTKGNSNIVSTNVSNSQVQTAKTSDDAKEKTLFGKFGQSIGDFGKSAMNNTKKVYNAHIPDMGVMRNARTLRRVFMRTVKANTVISRIVQELSVINGFYSIMKSQYDFEMDYYSRILAKEEYTRIWEVIQSQPEYQKFMVPIDAKSRVDGIIKDEWKNIPKLRYNPMTDDKTTDTDIKIDNSQ